ncbi:hypothetical protein PILCRDRAFT_91736 [Piloderma croceum F 1598]|uniref:Uncharacterized protein n=1 Tax=Piloderma croceum (strain F 1598) TaxID=765440 RepID=A0A0C3AQQ1_PILCF|nr:hypothetical protein PILCRDRAFT_91736 [Piloderma croceum F 1598]
MTLQAILTSLKKFHGKRQPANLHPAPVPHPILTRPFCSAKQIPPAHLESLYISNMSDSFVEACPGDILSTKVVVANDKSSGSFRHENRPKLPALIEPWWDDPKYQVLYNSFADERGVRGLPFQVDDAVHDNMQRSETTGSIDSVINVKMVVALEAVLLADVASHDQSYTDIASCLTESPAPPSVSCVSFDNFESSDEFKDVDLSTINTASSIDILGAIHKASPVTGGASKVVKTYLP